MMNKSNLEKYYNDKLERKYTHKHIKKIMEIHYEEIENWLMTPLREEEKLCFVFEKPNAIFNMKNGKIVKKDKKYLIKDGIHLMFPYMVTPWAFHKKVREYVVSYFKKNNIFQNIHLENSMYDIFDLSIINRNNTRIVWVVRIKPIFIHPTPVIVYKYIVLVY